MVDFPVTEMRPRSSLRKRLETYLVAGVLLTAPLGITLYASWALINFADGLADRLLPGRLNPEAYLPFTVPGLGVVVMLVLLTLIGYLTANFVGRSIVAFGERIVRRLPFLRTVYVGAKQVIGTIVSDQSGAFRQVVLVEYPKRGIWSAGFLSSAGPEEVQDRLGRELITVFVPTTPNPIHGLLLFVPPEDVTYTSLTVEQGLRLIISGGIVGPDGVPVAANR